MPPMYINAGAWVDLDKLLDGEFVHASGATLRVGAVSIDSGDGPGRSLVWVERPRRCDPSGAGGLR